MDPKNMWLAMAAAVAVFGGMKALQPKPDAGTGEPFAVVSVGYGRDLRIEKINRAQCLASGDRIWTSHSEGNDCTTVILPPTLQRVGAVADQALIFIDGDVPDAEHTAQGEEEMRRNYKQMTATLSDRFGVPVLVVARPGVLGSSGVHLAGGKRDDVHVIDAALNELKRTYGFRALVMAGQSGGARMIAQLLVTGRSDIVCGVMGSGAYDVPRTRGSGWRSTNIFGNPGRSFLVPMHDIANVPGVRSRRLFVVGDRADRITPFDEQQAWAEKLLSLGHHAVLIEGEGRGDARHGLSQPSLAAAGLCARGASDAEIVAAAGKRVVLPGKE